jgi:hypothetical protein
LPVEVPDVFANYLWAVARGNFVRGIRALIWDRPEDAAKYFARGVERGFEVDDSFVKQVTFEFQGYELAYGVDASLKKLASLSATLRNHLSRRSVNWLTAGYLLYLASRDYRQGMLARVPTTILRAMAFHPRFLLDRGIVSLLVKSILGVKPAMNGSLGRTEIHTYQ